MLIWLFIFGFYVNEFSSLKAVFQFIFSFISFKHIHFLQCTIFFAVQNAPNDCDANVIQVVLEVKEKRKPMGQSITSRRQASKQTSLTVRPATDDHLSGTGVLGN